MLAEARAVTHPVKGLIIQGLVTQELTSIIISHIKVIDLLHHEVLLPFNADEKFKDVSNLMNLVESHESRIDSQVLKEYVLALPDDKDVSLDIKKEMVYEFIAKNRFPYHQVPYS